VGHRYGVLGAGRQGAAAAYDLLIRGDAESVLLGDVDPSAATAAAARVNALARTDRARGTALDVRDADEASRFLGQVEAAISSASYRFNLALSELAIDAGTSLCDLGGNLGVVRAQLQLHDRARAAGVAIVPDCGEAPGLSSNLMARARDLLDLTEELLLLDGGLPEDPEPPWNYALTFNVDGLTNEYAGTTVIVRDGELTEVACFDPSEYELIDFGPSLGTLEAFVAAGGSTTPWTLGKGLRSLKNKVLRYPGHAAQFSAFRDLGLFGEDAVDVGGTDVVPREVFHSLLEPRIRAGEDTRDIVVARAVARGAKDGKPARATVDLRASFDDELGFTAMQETTGWHAAIVCSMVAAGDIAPGAVPVELAIDPERMMKELARRGFEVKEDVQWEDGD
jgi:lysine 6-dehydrogenase